jgi:hypothetical protein
MSKPYKFGVIIDDRDEAKSQLILEAFFKTFGRSKRDDLFIKNRTIGSCIYFGDGYTGWNPHSINHSSSCEKLYSLKNDWAQIINEPIMAPFVKEKHRALITAEKLKPYFYRDEVIDPSKGCFILPADIMRQYGDQYFDCDKQWEIISEKSNIPLIKITKGNYYTHARPIKGNEELYNKMEISTIRPLHPELKEPYFPEGEPTIPPPYGYYYLSVDDELKQDDFGFYPSDNSWCNVNWNNYTSDSNYQQYKKSKSAKVIAYARKASASDEAHAAIMNLKKIMEDKEKETMNDKDKLSKVAIRVGTSPTLLKMVEELYFSKEIYYLGKKGESIGVAENDYGENRCLHNDTHYLKYSPQDYYKQRNYKILDAATQMGEIVALFEEPVIKVPEIHGCKATYLKNEDIITFECANIDIKLLRAYYGIMIMGYTPSGNRVVKSIELSSGKTLNQEQLKEILEYVDAVNSAK